MHAPKDTDSRRIVLTIQDHAARAFNYVLECASVSLTALARGERHRQTLPLSSTSHTLSRHSLVTRSASSITCCGMARLALSLAVPFACFDFSPLVPLALAIGWTETSDSARTSERTRRRSSGYVDISPERRRERAWLRSVVGQLAGEACKACRRASWILGVQSVRQTCGW
jgi:hypothetical protein